MGGIRRNNGRYPEKLWEVSREIMGSLLRNNGRSLGKFLEVPG